MSLKRIAISLIRFYRKKISVYTMPKCRFVPTCSEYGIEAIEKFGFLKGSLLTLWRFLRCNPFSKPGVDPVPEKKNI